ncbi:MAG: hydrolase 1, exosortase A system-associated [Sphingopyxis sp.]
MGDNMRRWLSFDVAGACCAATIDEGRDSHGLLIVSGGNEIRTGAHRAMARLAALVSGAGHPVFRFDRRGIGDSEGENGGFLSSAADIAAAVAHFRTECPHITRITAFGNCDAASAAVLHHHGVGINALILANPWVIDADCTEVAPDDAPAMPPPAVIRARYLAKIKNPHEWLRLLRGGVDLRKLARGIRSASASTPSGTLSGLAAKIADGITSFDGPITILIASRDGTAIAFMAALSTGPLANACKPSARKQCYIRQCNSASHSFSDDAARAWFDEQILSAMASR